MHQDDRRLISRHTVGGTQLSRVVKDAQSCQIEVVRRRSDIPFEWRYEQPLPMLLWLSSGVKRYRLNVDGVEARSNKPASPGALLIPAFTAVSAEFELQGDADYTVVFFKKTERTERLFRCLDEPRLGVVDDDLKRSLSLFAREAIAPDDLFELTSESLVVQTLAFFSRSQASTPKRFQGGLTGANTRRTEEYVHAHLADKLLVSELAKAIGFSPRHFIRAFRETFHETPMQFVLNLRFQEAKKLLGSTNMPITEIALSCGFSHAQHFSGAFRKHVGISPSEFRRVFSN